MGDCLSRTFANFLTSTTIMFIFSCNSILILSYLLLVNSIKIEKIQNALILNSTSTLQSNCSTCICQCMPYLSSSSLCCYVNCYINNNTCQVIISPSTSNPAIIVDKTSVVYKTNCSIYSNTTKSSTTNHANLMSTGTTRIISSTKTTTTTTTTTASTTTYTTLWWCPICTGK